MPIRALKASTASAGAHVKANLRVWTSLLFGLCILMAALRWSDLLGLGGLWSDILVLCAMALGVLLIMISHEGYDEEAGLAEGAPPAI